MGNLNSFVDVGEVDKANSYLEIVGEVEGRQEAEETRAEVVGEPYSEEKDEPNNNYKEEEER